MILAARSRKNILAEKSLWKIFKVEYFKIFSVNFKILWSKVAKFIYLLLIHFLASPFAPIFPLFHFKIGGRLQRCMGVEWMSLLQNRLPFPIEVFSPTVGGMSESWRVWGYQGLIKIQSAMRFELTQGFILASMTCHILAKFYLHCCTPLAIIWLNLAR